MGPSPGRGVRSRGDAPYPRRQARRAVDEAGDCDWPQQGSTRGGETRCASQGAGEDGDAAERHRGLAGRTARTEAFAQARGSDRTRAEARAETRGHSRSARASGEDGRAASRPHGAEGCGQEGGGHKGAGRTEDRGGRRPRRGNGRRRRVNPLEAAAASGLRPSPEPHAEVPGER
jgi:hypothetical protein